VRRCSCSPTGFPGSAEYQIPTDRTARRVRTFTERAARPLDTSTEQLLATLARLSHTLNPVRITGRVVELGANATLRANGAITARGGRFAHTLTGQR
jgi:hypothetical protein